GDVHRVNQGTAADVTASELVVVDTSEQTLHWTRGSEACGLALEAGCSHGCYDKVIVSGQTCVIEGQTLVLTDGLLESTAEGIPAGSVRVTMTWAVTASGAPVYVDHGLLAPH